MSSPSVVSMFRARNLVAKAARNSVTSSLTARGVPIRLASTTPPHNPSSTPSGSSPNEPRWTTNSSGSDEPAYNWQNILLLAGLAGIGYFIYDFRKRSKAEREAMRVDMERAERRLHESQDKDRSASSTSSSRSSSPSGMTVDTRGEVSPLKAMNKVNPSSSDTTSLGITSTGKSPEASFPHGLGIRHGPELVSDIKGRVHQLTEQERKHMQEDAHGIWGELKEKAAEFSSAAKDVYLGAEPKHDMGAKKAIEASRDPEQAYKIKRAAQDQATTSVVTGGGTGGWGLFGGSPSHAKSTADTLKTSTGTTTTTPSTSQSTSRSVPSSSSSSSSSRSDRDRDRYSGRDRDKEVDDYEWAERSRFIIPAGDAQHKSMIVGAVDSVKSLIGLNPSDTNNESSTISSKGDTYSSSESIPLRELTVGEIDIYPVGDKSTQSSSSSSSSLSSSSSSTQSPEDNQLMTEPALGVVKRPIPSSPTYPSLPSLSTDSRDDVKGRSRYEGSSGMTSSSSSRGGDTSRQRPMYTRNLSDIENPVAYRLVEPPALQRELGEAREAVRNFINHQHDHTIIGESAEPSKDVYRRLIEDADRSIEKAREEREKAMAWREELERRKKGKGKESETDKYKLGAHKDQIHGAVDKIIGVNDSLTDKVVKAGEAVGETLHDIGTAVVKDAKKLGSAIIGKTEEVAEKAMGTVKETGEMVKDYRDLADDVRRDRKELKEWRERGKEWDDIRDKYQKLDKEKKKMYGEEFEKDRDWDEERRAILKEYEESQHVARDARDRALDAAARARYSGSKTTATQPVSETPELRSSGRGRGATSSSSGGYEEPLDLLAGGLIAEKRRRDTSETASETRRDETRGAKSDKRSGREERETSRKRGSGVSEPERTFEESLEQLPHLKPTEVVMQDWAEKRQAGVEDEVKGTGGGKRYAQLFMNDATKKAADRAKELDFRRLGNMIERKLDKRDTVKETLEDAYENVSEKASDAKEWTKDKAKDVTEAVKGAVRETNKAVATPIVEKAEDAYDWAKETAVDAKDMVKSKAKDVKETVKDKTEDVVDWSKEKASDATEWTKDKAKDVKETVKDKAEDLVDWSKEKASDATEWTKDKAKDVKDTVKDVVKGAVNETAHKVEDAKDWAGEKASEVIDWTKHKVEDVKDISKDAAKQVSRSARDMAGGEDIKRTGTRDWEAEFNRRQMLREEDTQPTTPDTTPSARYVVMRPLRSDIRGSHGEPVEEVRRYQESLGDKVDHVIGNVKQSLSESASHLKEMVQDKERFGKEFGSDIMHYDPDVRPRPREKIPYHAGSALYTTSKGTGSDRYDSDSFRQRQEGSDSPRYSSTSSSYYPGSSTYSINKEGTSSTSGSSGSSNRGSGSGSEKPGFWVRKIDDHYDRKYVGPKSTREDWTSNEAADAAVAAQVAEETNKGNLAVLFSPSAPGRKDTTTRTE